MSAADDTCPCCGKWTSEGLRKYEAALRDSPLYGIDIKKPVVQLLEETRSKIAYIRGELGDIGRLMGRERTNYIEGLLTCALVTLAYTIDNQKKDEAEWAAQTLERPAACADVECPGELGWLDGYGLAGGGCGAYKFCEKCGRVTSKTQDHDEGAKP